MTSHRYLYSLGYDDPNAYVLVDYSWEAIALQGHWCIGCRTLNRALFPQPIDVRVSALPRLCPIGFVYETPIGIIRDDVRQLLSPWLTRFVFGECYNTQGIRIPSHFTFYSKDYVANRMGPGTRYAQCDRCGTIQSQRAGPGKDGGTPSLLSYEVADQPIVQNWYCATFVSEAVVAAIDAPSVHRLKCWRVAVVERPRDGVRFPTDPDDVTGESPPVRDFRRHYRD